MIISAEQDKWLKRSRVCRCAAGDQGEEGEKGRPRPRAHLRLRYLPSLKRHTGSVETRAQPREEIWPSVKCFCLQFYEQAGSGFSAPETRNLSRGTAEEHLNTATNFPD